jgi:hypothetical protein
MHLPGFTAEKTILREASHQALVSTLRNTTMQQTRMDAFGLPMVRPALERICHGNTCCFWRNDGGFIGCRPIWNP